MKYLAVVILATIVALSACSTVTYTNKDVTIKYTRFFAGSDGIKVMLGDKAVAEINKQSVDTELLKSVLGQILGGVK